MKKFLRISMIMVSFIFVFAPATLIAYPTVYPRGTTVYKPDKCWNGYTIIPTSFNSESRRELVNTRRHYSRILEINPVTLEIVWQYRNSKFFSPYASGMQRLPDGNTLITESGTGRVFEVTSGKEIVWEYIRPTEGDGICPVFRAYRIPYDWIPQLREKPIEKAGNRGA